MQIYAGYICPVEYGSNAQWGFYCTDYICQTSAGLGAQTTSAVISNEVPRCYVPHDDGFRFSFHYEPTTI